MRNFPLKSIVSLVVVLALVVCSSTQAAPIFKFSAVYEDSLDPDTFGSLPYDLLTDPLAAASDDYQQFGLFIETIGASDSAPEESFASALLDVELTGGLTAATFMGAGLYAGEPISADPNGGFPPPFGPVFANNEDAGADTTDLQRIVIIAVADTSYSHTADVGKSGPQKLGTFYLNYDYTVAAVSTVNIGENVPDDSLSYYADAAQELLGSSGFMAGDPVEVIVPEPASIVLAGLALLGLVGLKRRRS